MVSSNNERSPRCQSEENINLRSIEEVVEQRDQGEEKHTGERKEKGKEVTGVSTCEAELQRSIRQSKSRM